MGLLGGEVVFLALFWMVCYQVLIGFTLSIRHSAQASETRVKNTTSAQLKSRLTITKKKKYYSKQCFPNNKTKKKRRKRKTKQSLFHFGKAAKEISRKS